MLQIRQIRYKYPFDEDYSDEILKTDFFNIDIVQDILNNKPIVELGIQAVPGTPFSINNQDLKMNATGIYELNQLKIYSLTFGFKDKDKIELNNDLKRIAVDIIYEEGGM